MRPILLKGHERSLTMVKYNRDGDLLFTCSKDHCPSIWYAENGERIGTYNGHSGSVWCCDINFNSTRLLTGAADNTCKLWDVETGTEIKNFKHTAPVRAVGFALGDKQFLTVLDNIMGNLPTIFVYDLDEDPTGPKQSDEPRLKITGHTAKINRAVWGPLNKTIFSASDDGTVRLWDPETGKQTQILQDHKKAVNDLQFSWDMSNFITASADHTARLYDTATLTCLKKFETERPLNSAHISPLSDCPYCIVGGGQDAQSVTTTSSKMGKFDTTFFHKVYGEELGAVKGHFGPVNTLQFSPNGCSYASGGEDGYVRVHHFDPDYFTAYEKIP